MRVAIVGCGQLARMLALSGIPLGIKFSFIADDGLLTNTDCVDGLGTIVPWQFGVDAGDLYQALEKPDVVTVEKEQVDIRLLQALEHYTLIRPGVSAIEQTQSRLAEKRLLERLGVSCADYYCGEDLGVAVAKLGYPFLLKSLSGGYDGKNQWLIDSDEALANYLKDRGDNSPEVLAEQWIHFQRELSLIAVRDAKGAISFYPLTENSHHHGILYRSIAPAENVSDQEISQAQCSLQKIMDSLDYVGVMAMECFSTDQGLLVNELAPRVHNSGHWTQTGGVTSQFENHIRAIAGMEPGSTGCSAVAAGMINLLGTTEPPFAAIGDRSTLHWYNKQPKPGRKQGHVNFVANSMAGVVDSIAEFEKVYEDSRPTTSVLK